jgi:hypothetical protein
VTSDERAEKDLQLDMAIAAVMVAEDSVTLPTLHRLLNAHRKGSLHMNEVAERLDDLTRGGHVVIGRDADGDTLYKVAPLTTREGGR